jgi:hypothetical protein
MSVNSGNESNGILSMMPLPMLQMVDTVYLITGLIVRFHLRISNFHLGYTSLLRDRLATIPPGKSGESRGNGQDMMAELLRMMAAQRQDE